MAKRLHTHYDNLKVARDASPQAIRAAYRALCKRYHPDHHPTLPDAQRIMSIINQSYDVLTTPEKKQKHDEWIAKHQPKAEREMPEKIASPMPGGFRRPREPLNYRKMIVWLVCVALLIIGVFYYTEHLRYAAEPPPPTIGQPPQ